MLPKFEPCTERERESLDSMEVWHCVGCGRLGSVRPVGVILGRCSLSVFTFDFLEPIDAVQRFSLSVFIYRLRFV